MTHLLSNLFKTNLSSFRAAILANNTNRICRILDVKHYFINKALDSSGNTPLIFAIKFALPLTVQLLLNQGAQPDQPHCTTYQTPLSILASLIDPDDEGSDGEHAQEMKTVLQMATMLLNHDAYIDKPSPFMYIDERGQQYEVKETPLMTAVRTRNLPLATLLIDRKANLNYLEKRTQQRPVHIAVLNGDEAMFDLLENAGASCRTVVSDANNTLLHCFCSVKQNDGRQTLLRKLLALGCDVNAENDQERTPLMLAARANMVETCETLLRAHAETERVDFRGQRAIDLAGLGSDCFRLLLHNAQVERRKSQPLQQTDRIVFKKQIISHRPIPERIDQSGHQFQTESRKRLRSSSDRTRKDAMSEVRTDASSDKTDRQVDGHGRYHRFVSKFMRTKERMTRRRDASVQRTQTSLHPQHNDRF